MKQQKVTEPLCEMSGNFLISTMFEGPHNALISMNSSSLLCDYHVFVLEVYMLMANVHSVNVY